MFNGFSVYYQSVFNAAGTNARDRLNITSSISHYTSELKIQTLAVFRTRLAYEPSKWPC